MTLKSGIYAALLSATSQVQAAVCDSTKLNTTITQFNITTNDTSIFDIARETNRGVCDIGRQNLMADVTIIPNIGQTILIPPQTCTPDNSTCLLSNVTRTRECIYGGPRLYYTVNGDTYDLIAQRLNITTESMMGQAHGDATGATVIDAGQFLKVPQCSPSQCIMQPYQFPDEPAVYSDLAKKYGTTVGQIMSLSPGYNYSTSLLTNATRPTIVLPINCTALSGNTTILS